MVRVGLLTRLSSMQAGIKYRLFCFVFLFFFCCVNWLYVAFSKNWEAALSVYKQNIVNLLHNIMCPFFSSHNHNCLVWVSRGVFSTSVGFYFIDIAFFL